MSTRRNGSIPWNHPSDFLKYAMLYTIKNPPVP